MIHIYWLWNYKHVTKSGLVGDLGQNLFRIKNDVSKHHGHLPLINLPPRENLIAGQKQHLIVQNRLYHPRFKTQLRNPHNKYLRQNRFYNQNYHTGKKLTRDFQSLLSKIQNQHNYKKTFIYRKETNQYPKNPALHSILPVVIEPVIQIDQEASKYANYLLNKLNIHINPSEAHHHHKSSLCPLILIPCSIPSLQVVTHKT